MYGSYIRGFNKKLRAWLLIKISFLEAIYDYLKILIPNTNNYNPPGYLNGQSN